MFNRRLVALALEELSNNQEQYQAVHEKGHCVVLAGPGSGKTKTLTTAMARSLIEDVAEPRGIACITYNNECAIELESRLARLGVEPSERVFVGTVHSFALTQIILPYARCVLPDLPANLRVASRAEIREAVEAAHKTAIGLGENPHERWKFAEYKRRTDVDRTDEAWTGRNPELALFVESYERELRSRGLIDFDDMPLIAYRMLRETAWIGKALLGRFPVLFIDEYQDLGHALHEIVLTLCFGAGLRLFAVGDPDQSIYRFNGANPQLLLALTRHEGVRSVNLRLNYRCGKRIIAASSAALGEERDYLAPETAAEGDVFFKAVDGGLDAQAKFVVETLLPELLKKGIPPSEIAILYRTAEQGGHVASAASAMKIPIVRADNQALVRRNSRLSRWVEALAKWSAGGWKVADPPFRRLLAEAVALVFGGDASIQERYELELELAGFLSEATRKKHTANSWLRELNEVLLAPWRLRARAITDEWEVVNEMIDRTEAAPDNEDMPLAHFGGHIGGSGRVSLSTLHSAKGREFEVVILYAMNNDVIPTWRERTRPQDGREARRLFYVGVTRARRAVYLIYKKGQHSPWAKELYDRLQP